MKFNFFKKKGNEKQEHLSSEQEAESFKKLGLFMQADREAAKKAGLENKPGTYYFACPFCKNICESSWVWNLGSLHGRTGCDTCKIHFMV